MPEGPQKRDHLCTRLVDGLLLTIGSGLVNRSILTAGSTSSRFVSFFAFHSFTQPPTQWPDTLGELSLFTWTPEPGRRPPSPPTTAVSPRTFVHGGRRAQGVVNPHLNSSRKCSVCGESLQRFPMVCDHLNNPDCSPFSPFHPHSKRINKSKA